MKIFFKILTLVLIPYLLQSCSSNKTPGSNPQNSLMGPKPGWLIEQPISQSYYIGIGSASKTKFGSEAQKSAEDAAMANLASQITVTISSDIVTRLIENGSMTEEEYLATTRSRTAADIEGHEFVDSWQDQNYYYSYVRLSKAQYASIQARKRQAALDLSTDFLQKAKSASAASNFTETLNHTLQAFTPIVPYLNEALEATVDGQTVIMSNEVNQFLMRTLSDVSLEFNKAQTSGKLGKSLPGDLTVQASHKNGSPWKNLPIRMSFKKGSGELLESLVSNQSGVGKVLVSSITSGEKLQILQASIDIDKFISPEMPPVLRGILGSATLSTATLTLDVTNPTIYLESTESFNGYALAQLQVEPKLKNYFIQQGFHFVDNPRQADWQMSLKANVTRGTEFSGMYTAFADVSVSVTDRSNGDEIYKNSLSRIKGIDLNYTAAANKALSNSADKLNASILNQIMKSLK